MCRWLGVPSTDPIVEAASSCSSHVWCGVRRPLGFHRGRTPRRALDEKNGRSHGCTPGGKVRGLMDGGKVRGQEGVVRVRGCGGWGTTSLYHIPGPSKKSTWRGSGNERQSRTMSDTRRILVPTLGVGTHVRDALRSEQTTARDRTLSRETGRGAAGLAFPRRAWVRDKPDARGAVAHYPGRRNASA